MLGEVRRAVIALIMGLVLVTPAGADELPPIDPSGKGDWNPTCLGVTKRQSGARNVGFRLKCNFSIASSNSRADADRAGGG